VKSSIVERDRWQKIERSGVSALEGFPRENKDLRGVVKSRVDPSHWCWEGNVEEIHGLQRKNPSKRKARRRTPEEMGMKKSWSSIEIGHVALDQCFTDSNREKQR
jgi:hypothetical protein